VVVEGCSAVVNVVVRNVVDRLQLQDRPGNAGRRNLSLAMSGFTTAAAGTAQTRPDLAVIDSQIVDDADIVRE
jgi:hypothetical protein